MDGDGDGDGDLITEETCESKIEINRIIRSEMKKVPGMPGKCLETVGVVGQMEAVFVPWVHLPSSFLETICAFLRFIPNTGKPQKMCLTYRTCLPR